MSHHIQPRLIAVFLILLLMTSFVSAQEVTPEVTEEPVLVEEQPAPEITEEATLALTEEPTAIPTETVPEVTEEPAQDGETPTPEASEEPEQTTEPDAPTPDIVSAPPIFEIAASLTAEAGQPLSIPFIVYDEQGAVVITQIDSAAGAPTVLEIAAPTQDSPPYATTGTIIYTTAETASGTDTLTLTAVDGAGMSATAVVQIDIRPVPIVEVTEEATAEATEDATPTVERIISYDSNASEESIQAMLAALNATEVSRIPQIGAMKVLVPETMANAAQAMAAVQGNSAAVMAGVTAIEENVIYQIDFIPNDPAFVGATQWPLKDYTGGMYTYLAWDIAKQDGMGVRVAVLDTGVDFQHPDLSGQIDAAKGWDFINDDNNPDDDHVPPSGIGGHGTHVAGIIAARTNNSLFMAGVAFRAKIIPIKVCAASTGCPTYEIAAGIVHAVDKGAHIINLSLSGSLPSTTVQGAVQYALSKNVTVVAASGNIQGGINVPQYPASYPGVISVASHDINGNIAPSSTHNNFVTVSAPGVSIYSLTRMDWPFGTTGAAFWSGTSAAAAHVSGVAALLYAENIARTPALIREALICSALDRGAAGYDEFFGYGMVQSDFAMNFTAASNAQANSPNCKITQPNDLIQNATPIKKIPFTVTQPVHSRSVTGDASEPGDCFTPNQTLWYKFVPKADDRYQITTFGSSFSTVIVVYQGIPGDFMRVGCVGAVFDPGAHVSVDMKKGQSYYIGVYTFGAAVNDQIMRLDVRPSMSVANKDYQENAAVFAYTGGWQSISANGGKLMQTYNDGGFATFTFRGSAFQLFRLVGPDQGSMEVRVNNLQVDFNGGVAGVQNLDNRAAFQAIEPVTISLGGTSAGQWNTVTIRRAAGGFAGPIAIDRIRPADLALKVITTKTDDRDASKLNYSFGNWTAAPSAGAFQNTMTRTTVQNAFVQARVKGSTVVIYRNVGPGFGSMNVFVDGLFWGTVDNSAPANAFSIPFAIPNLTPVEHVIRLNNNASSTLEFDAIEGRTTGAFGPNKQYNIGDKNVLRSGQWTVQNTPAAFGKKTYIASSANAWLDFNFTGDTFCLAFVRRADGGNIHIFVDDMSVIHERVSTNTVDNPSDAYFWPPDTLPGGIQHYCTGAAFGNGVHHVRVQMISTSPVELDYIFPGRYGILTAKNGLVQENDSRILHTPWVYSPASENSASLWRRIPMKSVGGASAQGGYLKRVRFDPFPTVIPVVRFFINGSGFILYTTSGPLAGELEVLVCPPAAVTCFSPDIILDGANVGTTINLNAAARARPFAYAVTGLGPGIHEILILADGFPGGYLDFDGVRVLP